MQRRPADFRQLGITSVELALLPLLTPTFTLADWIYVSQLMVVLGIAYHPSAPAGAGPIADLRRHPGDVPIAVELED